LRQKNAVDILVWDSWKTVELNPVPTPNYQFNSGTQVKEPKVKSQKPKFHIGTLIHFQVMGLTHV